MSNRVAFIFARGGSKGLKNKNILDFCGKPLIAHSILQAKESGFFDNVIVSSDSIHIMDIAREYGADVPFKRPDFLATDESPEWLSWQHAVKYYIENFGAFNIFVSMPATCPLRKVSDIKRAIELYESSDSDVTTCITDSYRNPYFNMLEKNSTGFLTRVISSDYFRRQDAPVTYDMTTVIFVTNPSFILKHKSIFQGKLNGLVVDRRSAIDIDNFDDFELAKMYYGKK